MFCRNCGKELSEGAAFCGNCGTALHTAPAAPAAENQTAPTPAAEGQAAPTTAAENQTASTNAAEGQAAPTTAAESQVTPAPAVESQDAPTPVAEGQAAPTTAAESQVTPNPAAEGQAAPTKKKKKKGLAVAIVLFLLIAAAGAAGFVLWNNDNFRCWLDVRQANKMYDVEDYDSAVDAYLQALERVEDSTEAMDGLLRVAKIYGKEEKHEDALAIYELLLERDPENQKALGGQRDCYLIQGKEALKQERFEKALDYYEKVLKINKALDSDEENEAAKNGRLQAYMGLAQQSFADSQYDKARDRFDAILADADRNSDLYVQAETGRAQATLALGRDSFQNGDFTSAETYYREILSQESVGSLAYQELATIYVVNGDVEGAIAILEEGAGHYDDDSLQERLTALQDSLKPAYALSPLRDENGNVYDLGGAEVYVYSWFGEGRPDSPYQEALDEYRKWAQETYNFTVTWDDSGSFDNYDDLADLASGAKDTDGKLRIYVLPGDQPDGLLAMKEGLLWDLSSLGVFDFNENRFRNNGVSSLYRIDGHVYACTAEPLEPGTGMYFNAALLEQLTGITADDMYDLQAKGEWTWEKFEEICEKIYQAGDTDNDGLLDVYAVSGQPLTFVNACLHSNNASLFRLDNDGKFLYQADAPATLNALEFQRKIRNAPYWYDSSASENGHLDYFSPSFGDDGKGRFVFLPEEAFLMYSLQMKEREEYGFLMFPKGPDATEYVNCHNDNFLVIPKCYTEEQAKIIAAAYDIWTADVIPGYLDYNANLDVYTSAVPQERALKETLGRMLSVRTFLDSSVLLPGVDTDVLHDTSKNVSKIISDNERAWKKAIDDFNNSYR